MDDINFIKFKNSLSQKDKKNKIKNSINSRVTQISNYETLRNKSSIDQELVLFVCNAVENLVKKKYKIDKKQFVVEIIDDLFHGLNQVEKDNVANVCQFLFDNALIQIVPVTEKITYFTVNWIKRKLL